MNSDIQKYLDSLDDARREQARELVSIISEVTGEKPTMWGSSIIAFGMYHYKYDSGREGDAPKIGLASRKQAFVIYGLGLEEQADDLQNLGKYKTGKGCLYISSLQDVDIEVLKRMLARSKDK